MGIRLGVGESYGGFLGSGVLGTGLSEGLGGAALLAPFLFSRVRHQAT
jgi:hypothetical protein